MSYKKIGNQEFHIQGVKQMSKEDFVAQFKGNCDVAPYSVQEAYDMIVADESEATDKKAAPGKSRQGKK